MYVALLRKKKKKFSSFYTLLISIHKSGESIAATLMLRYLRHLAGVSVKKDPQQETIMHGQFL